MNFLIEQLTVDDVLYQPDTQEYNSVMPTIVQDLESFLRNGNSKLDYQWSIWDCNKPKSFFYRFNEFIGDIFDNTYVD